MGFMLERSMYYYYELLDERQRSLYRKLLYAFTHFHREISIERGNSREDIRRVTEYILNDRPDIFWYGNGYTLTTTNGVPTMITMNSVYTESQATAVMREMENSTFFRELDRQLLCEKDYYNKVLLLYEYIIKNTDYDTRARDSSSDAYKYAYRLDGVVLKNRAVCMGYAKAFQYFASRHDIICTVVGGKTKKGEHAWNLVKMYGEYCYVDPTWGDPLINGECRCDNISYEYFCFTTKQMQETHSAVLDCKMPLCNAPKYYYYEHFGLIDSEYTRSGAARRIAQAKRNGKSDITLMYSTSTVFGRAYSDLISNNGIFDVLHMANSLIGGGIGTERVRYITSRETNSIEVCI